MFSLETIQTESSITRLQTAGVKYIEQDSFARYTKTNLTSVFNLNGAKHSRKHNVFVMKLRGATSVSFPHCTFVVPFNKTVKKQRNKNILRLIRSENGITGWNIYSLHIENCVTVFNN